MRILKRAAIAVANRFPLLSDESKMKIYCACITDPESAASRHLELLSRKPDQRMYADMRKALHKYGMFYDEYAVYGCDVNPPGDYCLISMIKAPFRCLRINIRSIPCFAIIIREGSSA